MNRAQRRACWVPAVIKVYVVVAAASAISNDPKVELPTSFTVYLNI